MKRDADGGLTLYIQHGLPGKDKARVNDQARLDAIAAALSLENEN